MFILAIKDSMKFPIQRFLNRSTFINDKPTEMQLAFDLHRLLGLLSSTLLN
jgi:hypothetical protein